MNKPLREQARQFWSASFYLRRATDRSPAIAIKILRSLTKSRFAPIATKSRSILEQYHERSDKDRT